MTATISETHVGNGEAKEKQLNHTLTSSNLICQIVWRNVIAFIFLHSSLLYGAYRLFFNPPLMTIFFATIVGFCSGLGITAGAHRLWSHRAYKAKLPLRILLAFFQTIAGQNDIYEWCRDHRVHHKFSETDADPHNVNRGFFFAHMGWLCVKKHPLVLIKGKSVDCSDLLADPVVRIQRKIFLPLAFICCIWLPTYIPTLCWQENWLTAFMIAGLARYCISLHVTWLVNSAAHLWGNRPYNQFIGARENIYVALGALGEGFHNYHHTFPWDYSASELGWNFNFSTVFIDFCAIIGQAYDRKSVSSSVIQDRIDRTGNYKEHYYCDVDK